jgi:serine/threonine-protein kinase RsbT
MTMPVASSSVIEECLAVRGPGDAAVVSAAARRFAERMGFSGPVQWRIATAVSEAATNIVKFAGAGELTLRFHPEAPARLEFEATDHGPGIPDVPAALCDGFSEGLLRSPETFNPHHRGQGSGLPAIARLMDNLALSSLPGGGLILRACKYLP